MKKRIKNKKNKTKKQIMQLIREYEATAQRNYDLGDRIAGDLAIATANGLYEALELMR